MRSRQSCCPLSRALKILWTLRTSRRRWSSNLRIIDVGAALRRPLLRIEKFSNVILYGLRPGAVGAAALRLQQQIIAICNKLPSGSVGRNDGCGCKAQFLTGPETPPSPPLPPLPPFPLPVSKTVTFSIRSPITSAVCSTI